MPETCLNLIGGAWVAGDHAVENRNPSDLADLIGLYAAGSAQDVACAVAAARGINRRSPSIFAAQ